MTRPALLPGAGEAIRETDDNGGNVPIASMTGFARQQGQVGDCAWSWEVRSVNGKGRDVRCRVPNGFESLDQTARARAANRLQRGNIFLTLTAKWQRAGSGYRINEEALRRILALMPEISRSAPGARPPSVDGLLSLSGVMEPVEEEQPEEARRALEAAILSGLDAAIESLAAMRSEEGGRLAPALAGQLDTIAGLCERAETLAAAQPEAIRERLREQVAALLEQVPALPEERLAQEAAVLMTKADLREELDRLKAHVAAARDLMAGGGAVGRKLDFLCQEFNREANTLCSKSTDVELTRVGLDLKAAIDQFREQALNIE